jgi:glycerophosphoryl diester phosphodiesterase
MMKIGHKGAAALAPENTLRSIQLALEHGVDMVEIDVLRLADDTLVLAHSDDLHEVSHGAARGRMREETFPHLRTVAPELPTLDEALDYLAPADVGVQLDLKWQGYEPRVVECVRRHGLVERTLVSSCFARSLRRVAELEPRLARALTYPFDRHGISRRRIVLPFVHVGLATLRRTLPPRIARMLDGAEASVATLHYLVVSRATVERCHARGAQVLAWTVDRPPVLRRLAALGVDGVITNDPRIFAATL